MLWVYPSLLSIRCDSSDNNYDDLGEENDIILHHNSADEHDKPQLDAAKQPCPGKQENSVTSKTVILSPPRPPLYSNNLNNIMAPSPTSRSADERRPRSDSQLSAVSECSVDAQPTNLLESRRKYLEILVHNVSHTDMILGLSSDDEHKRMSSLMSSGIKVPFPDLNENVSIHENENENKQPFGDESNNQEEKYILCRPRFSAFDMFSKRLVDALQNESLSKSDSSDHSNQHPLRGKIISYPRYERSNACARYTLVTPRPSDQYLLPVGFNLEHSGQDEAAEGSDELKIDHNTDLPSLRLRGRDISRVDPSLLGETPRRTFSSASSQPLASFLTPSRNPNESNLRMSAVFFPLLSTLLPRWLGQIKDKFGPDKKAQSSNVAAPLYAPNVKKVIVLVSGVGTPRNWTHSINGNSTQACAELMERFINALYPDITVVKIHSETNIFRWEENITFATSELMPCIDAYRNAHARNEPYPDEINATTNGISRTERNEFNPDWKQSVSVTYSFADGSAARSFAIQAALRPYRPTYFHFWQLKTFWHESKITDEDIEVHSFEEMETVPAMAIDQTSSEVSKTVAEIIQFRKDFLETLKAGGRSDMKKFWLRKTRKPVLAVLLVRKSDGTDILYRGTNMEVSMPTGSLCAERNVIGTALAQNPGLKREDLLMVAVLAVTLPEEPSKLPSPPPGGATLCQPISPDEGDGAVFVREVEEKLKQHQSTSTGGGGVRRSSSFASITEESPKPADWEMDVLQPESSAGKEAMASENGKEELMIPDLGLPRQSTPSRTQADSVTSGGSTPKRRIVLYGKSSSRKAKSSTKIAGGVKKQKQAFVLQSLEDLNPLKPCGACNEWLKKIAESNPDFKVLTFTDAQCNGVYVSPCED